MRVTEQSNNHTKNIDRAEASQIPQLIGAADRQIFGSSSWGKGLLATRFVNQLKDLRQTIRDVLAMPKGKVIIGGAGTSGRLAIHAAATWTRVLGADRVIGLMAGGMDAFYRAVEQVEDNPRIGARDLEEVISEGGAYIYIGISCGLSAAYVAGQVHKAMYRNAVATAVVGFNAIENANDRSLPGLSRHFQDILYELTQHASGYLLNPVLAPEPIAGSTRMKGGTATKIILDLLLGSENIEADLAKMAKLQKEFYNQCEFIPSMIEKAAQALRSGNAIVYLSEAHQGLMAMLDASECPPTFGARPQQVRAYVDDSFQQILPDFDLEGHRFRDFPFDGEHVFFVIGESDQLSEVCQNIRSQGHELISIPGFDHLLSNEGGCLHQAMKDLCLKWTLNLISTGAFIRYGKIYGNMMIDLKISNLKLWDRACRMVTKLAKVSPKIAEDLLIEVICGEKDQEPALDELISFAVTRERLIATAIVMGRGSLSLEDAEKLLDEQPVLRNALDQLK